MLHWILILVIHVANGGGAATAQFDTKQACITAGDHVTDAQGGFFVHISYTCEPTQ